MDKQTIDTYNSEAESIAQLHATLTPHRIYELIDHYFIKAEVSQFFSSKDISKY